MTTRAATPAVGRRLVALALLISALAPRSADAASARDRLAQILRSAKDYKQRVAAAIGLARLNDRQAVPALIDALKDPQGMVRGTVAGALGKLGDQRAKPALEALLKREQDPFVLRGAQSALAALLRRAPTQKPLDPNEMHVEGTLGSLDEEAAESGVNARLRAAMACYTRERTSAPFLAGRLDLKFRVTTAGTVRWVRISRSDLGSLSAERCIVGELAKATFTAPDGGEAEFSIPLTFDPQAVGVASGAPAAPVRAPAEVKKLLKACKKVVSPGGGAAALVLPSGLLVTMYVDPDGAILSAGLSSTSGEIPPEVATVLVTRIKAVKLPARDDGHTTKVVTPFACPASR
jgi:HEAT repeat protein